MIHARLLVSVRDGVEAQAALRGGADIIDAKDPARGALGQVSPQALVAIAAMVDGRKALSIARSELLDAAESSAATMDLPHSVRYQKFGMASTQEIDWASHALACAQQSDAVQTILVAYADHHRCGAANPMAVLEWVLDNPSFGILFDTAVKDGTSLFDWLDATAIQTAIHAMQQSRQLIGLAGSLCGDAFDQALALRPNVIGVRGAACNGTDRQSTIDETRVRELAQLIAARNAPPMMMADHAES